MKQSNFWTIATPVLGFALVALIAFGIGQLLLFTHDAFYPDKDLAKLMPVVVALVLATLVGVVTVIAQTRFKN